MYQGTLPGCTNLAHLLHYVPYNYTCATVLLPGALPVRPAAAETAARITRLSEIREMQLQPVNPKSTTLAWVNDCHCIGP